MKQLTGLTETEDQFPALDKGDHELQLLHRHLSECENGRTAMLGILEYLNESAGFIYKAKRDWECTFDAISDPIFIHDRGLKIVRANLAYIKAADLSFQEILGRPYYEVFPRMERPFLSCSRALRSHVQETEEITLADIGKTYLIKFFPIYDDSGNYRYSVHILEDVTEIRRSEERLKDEVDITSNLLSIAEATNDTTDINRLMEKVVRSVATITQSEACLSYIRNKEAGVFRPVQSYGLPEEMLPVYLSTPLEERMEFLQAAIAGKDMILLQSKDRIQASGLSFFKAFNSICVMVLNGKTGKLGFLISLSTKPVVFSPKSRKVAIGITRTVSLALEEAESYKNSVEKDMELANKIETIQVMHDIDRAILSTLAPDLLLENAIMNIPRLIPCDRATIVLADKTRELFTYVAGFGLNSLSKGATVPFRDTSTTEVVKTGRPQYVASLKNGVQSLLFEKRLLEEGFLSHVKVPLRKNGETIGVLSLGSKRTAAFNANDLTMLDKLASHISVALENSRLMTDMLQFSLGTIKALSSAIDAKSRWTAGHSERVTNYALNIAMEMGFSKEELRDMELAALLHDIGKIAVPEAILDKSSRLTTEETAVMRQHPVRGKEMIEPIKQFQAVLSAIEFHHEAFDGRGYPHGLKREEIPLNARILAVADSFDAMRSERPYRPSRPLDVIADEFKRCSGRQFDPEITGVFLNLLEREPLTFSG